MARHLGRSERAVREWCKQGLIQEAYKTQGKHWRIRKPISGKTWGFLQKRSSDWRFKKRFLKKGKGGFYGNWDPEFVEWLLLAQIYQVELLSDLPVPP